MKYWLFVDNLNGERFFVEAGCEEEAWYEAELVTDDPDELECLGICSEEESEALGYDVY